jgi:hypothetical protein
MPSASSPRVSSPRVRRRPSVSGSGSGSKHVRAPLAWSSARCGKMRGHGGSSPPSNTPSNTCSAALNCGSSLLWHKPRGNTAGLRHRGSKSPQAPASTACAVTDPPALALPIPRIAQGRGIIKSELSARRHTTSSLVGYRNAPIARESEGFGLDAELKTDAPTRAVPADDWALQRGGHAPGKVRYGTGFDGVIIINSGGQGLPAELLRLRLQQRGPPMPEHAGRHRPGPSRAGSATRRRTPTRRCLPRERGSMT